MVLKDGAKMSKSKGNLVGAIDMAEKYGCDTARLYTLFAAPPEKDLEWSEQGIEGCARFLFRVFRLVDRHAARLRSVSAAATADGTPASDKERAILRKAHQTLRRVSADFESRWHFNSSVALIMELVNELQANEPLDEGIRPEVAKEALELLTLMLTPMVPHLAEELWEMLGHASALGRAAWPEYLPQLAAEDEVEVVIQISGRVRAKIRVESDLPQADLAERARKDAKIAALLQGAQVKNVVVVPNKLVNFVVAPGAPKQP